MILTAKLGREQEDADLMLDKASTKEYSDPFKGR